jgi:hypothetical protein
VWSGDSEHGDDSFLGDADLGDECFDGGLALGGCAGVEDVVQVGADLLDGVGRGCGGLVSDDVWLTQDNLGGLAGFSRSTVCH